MSASTSTQLAVHVRAVTKTFGAGEAAVPALKGVDFDARQGELLMIVGPSGCGKTTLLSVIAGTLNFDGGEIDVFGSPLHAMKPRHITEFRKRHVGFIFQQFNLIPTLSCIENVSVPLLINGVSRRVAEQKAAELATNAGKQKLRSDALKEVRRIVKSAGGAPETVEAVFFTTFVMQ